MLFCSFHTDIISEQNEVGLWVQIDEQLLSRVMHSVPSRACEKCFDIDHSTRFCPRNLETKAPSTSSKHHENTANPSTDNNPSLASIDKRGRSIVKINGKTICNNHNESKGCMFKETTCYFEHICKTCFSLDHTVMHCQVWRIGCIIWKGGWRVCQ